ncbi:glycine zipper 2TM domain-containing protein [Lysobacter sp. M2-1]|uniref:glycine zipper 2TM domain-containing protein n=1 Tax=Lysobacter sp. M2-1 TaxID=2916839 RepID=UPI001F56CB64|nr:glycine zipper 2TM domain-containing protein [Lysobacter sp. M2-1]
MKSNTLAIALASLLVGGVAVAAFQNNRERSDYVATGQGGALGADAAFDSSIPSRGRLEYAQVIDVKPITEKQDLYAQVIGTEPVRESSTTSAPRQVCEDVVVQERLPERDGNVGGTVAGALIGGLVGNQVGSGNGRKLATAAGATAGGFIGNRVDRNHVGGRVVSRTDRQCRTVQDTSTSSRTVAYNVTYRNPDGTTGTMRTDSKPGDRIALGTEDQTIGYDVTYRYDGEERTIQMDERPGERLPVIDGQVVTQVASAEAGNTRG